jgi:hypothetical protein
MKFVTLCRSLALGDIFLHVMLIVIIMPGAKGTCFEINMDRIQALEGIQGSGPSTLKQMLLISPPAKEVPILERGIPFNLTAEYETKVVSYITEMQSIGFVLSRGDAVYISHCKEKWETNASFSNVPGFVWFCCDEFD